METAGEQTDGRCRGKQERIVVTEKFDLKARPQEQALQCTAVIAAFMHTVFIMGGPKPLVCGDGNDAGAAGAKAGKDILCRC